MYKLYKRNMVTFSIILIIAYIVLMSVAESISAQIGIQKIFTAPIFALFASVIFIFLKKYNLLSEHGLCKSKSSAKEVLFFIPLLPILTVNLWNGVALNYYILETVLCVCSMLCVGFIEEIIFRGFLFTAMSKDNIKVAIIVSSLTFGLGHIINLFTGANIFATLLQICYASAIGFMFTAIYYKTKSLVSCIITHSVFNSLSVFGVQGSAKQKIFASVFLCLVSICYSIFLLKELKDKEN